MHVPTGWPNGLTPLREAAALPGGMVCRTLRGRLTDGRAVVVKYTPYPAAVEADGLRALSDAGVPVPAVLGVAQHTLVLEYRSGRPDWPALGSAVARMHRFTGDAFGWHRDNRSGRFPQRNGRLDRWPKFYAERRVRVNLNDPSVPTDLAARLQAACDGPLLELLPPSPEPVLTHGDLWAGNIVDGRWLIDPEVSFADRELDLAYMEASGSLPPQFWTGYLDEYPLTAGYPERRPALQLHHLLLQVRHFGAERYRDRIEAVLDGYDW